MVASLAALAVALLLVLAVALSTLAERKVMAAAQRRSGPRKVGALGLLQPLADGIKLVLKESVLPIESSAWLFRMTPYFGFVVALLYWLFLPLAPGLALSELVGAGLLLIVALSELGIYSVILAGWSANSKYPLLGSLRSTAQMISYSIGLSLLILSRAVLEGEINLPAFLEAPAAAAAALLPLAGLFLVAAVAETNRAPFDLPEAESELVAGFFTEHSAITFASFFLAEFTSILAIGLLFAILFLGVGVVGVLPFLLFVLLLRAALARLRFDGLLAFGWKAFLPFGTGALLAELAALFLLFVVVVVVVVVVEAPSRLAHGRKLETGKDVSSAPFRAPTPRSVRDVSSAFC